MALVAAFAVAGCGSKQGPKVATAPAPAGAASGGVPASGLVSASPPAKQSDYDKARRYTRCMTENGEKMPDPVEGDQLSGYFAVRGEPVDKYYARHAAYEKCKQFLPATWPVKLDSQEVARTRGYVQCVRKHGIPEPVPDENGVVNELTDDQLFRLPGYDAAVRACRHLIDDPANNDPANK
jgi:hypothetical protein